MESTGFSKPGGVFRSLHRVCRDEILDLDLFRYCGCGCLTCPRESPQGTHDRQASFDRLARTRFAFDHPEPLGLNRTLPERLSEWLSSQAEKSLPSFVTVGIGAEPLPGFKDAQTVLMQSLRLLLKAGIGISFQTRQTLPEPLLELFSQHPGLVRVTLPIPALDETLVRAWEPGTASPNQRLYNVQRLRLAGVATGVNIKPLIPYVNDDAIHLDPLVTAIAESGARYLGAEFMRLGPTVRNRLSAHSPVSTRLIFGAYEPGPVDDRSDITLPNIPRRRRAYAHITQAVRRLREAHRTRLAFGLCRCTDPVLGKTSCLLWPGDAPTQTKPPERQTFSSTGRHPTGASRYGRRPAQVGLPGLGDSK